MGGPSKETLFSSVLNSFRLLDALTVSATIYFSGSLLARMISNSNAQFLGIPISHKYAIAVLAIVTVLHIGVTRYIIHYLHSGWKHLDRASRVELYYHVTGTGALLTKGAEKFRDRIRNDDGFLSVHVPPEDPPSMLHWLIFFLAVFSCTSFEISAWSVGSFFAGIVLAGMNWQIGASWLVALADFGRDANQSFYFDREETTGPRYIGIISGPWREVNTNVFTFAFVSFFDAVVRAIPLTGLFAVVWLGLEILIFLISP